jgi:hypothetical protein
LVKALIFYSTKPLERAVLLLWHEGVESWQVFVWTQQHKEANMAVRLIAVVRHGVQVGDHGPLSAEGTAQMLEVKHRMVDCIKSAGLSADAKRLTFSFTDTDRAIGSSRIIRGNGDIIVKDLFFDLRRDIKNPMLLAQDVLGLANHYEAEVVLVVAHGPTPAVLAETLARIAGKNDLGELRSPKKGCGYIVDMKTGHVMQLGPRGRLMEAHEEDLPQASAPSRAPVPPQTQVYRYPPAPTPVVQKAKPQPTFDDMDDDIPF